MAQMKRCFVNSLPDYPGGEVIIPKPTVEKWCSDVLNCVLSKQQKRHSDCDGGLYVGIAGVAYMNYYLSTLPNYSSKKAELLERAKSYLIPSLSYVEQSSGRRNSADAVGFLLGASGVYATAALIFNELGERSECEKYLEKYSSLVDICLPIQFLKCGSDELLVGRAGYMCGILVLNRKFGRNIVPDEKVHALWKVMVESGRQYAARYKSRSPLMYSYYQTEYLGAAHGVSGILQMLLSFPEYLAKEPEAEQTIKGAVDFMLSLQMPNGNFPCAMDEVAVPRSERDELIHWCHGAPVLLSKNNIRCQGDFGSNLVDIDDNIPGRSGIDYPTYNTVPKTSFKCVRYEYAGYFGDPETRCQAFHVCFPDGRNASFLCVNGTVFHQRYFVCDWWFHFNCTQAPLLYEQNKFRRPPLPVLPPAPRKLLKPIPEPKKMVPKPPVRPRKANNCYCPCR